MRKLLAVLAGLAMSLAVATVSGADKLKVGFIYVGPIGDHGWTYQHHQGLLAVEEAFGDKVETVYVENVAEGPDAERAITRLARDGAGIIFTTSFGYMDPTNKVAKNFPDVKFEHATGYRRDHANVTTYSARFYEGRYVIRPDRGQDVEERRRGVHRLVPDPRGGPGHQLLPAGRAVHQPRLQAEDRLGEHVVRPRQGGGRGQGADRPGRRHHHPAHRLHRAAADRGRAGRGRLRAGVGHDQVRAGHATHRDHRRLGAVLRRARQGGPRRHLGIHGHLGRHGSRHGRDGAVHEPAGRRGGDGEGRRRRRSPPASSTPSPARSTTRKARWSSARARCSTTVSCSE